MSSPELTYPNFEGAWFVPTLHVLPVALLSLGDPLDRLVEPSLACLVRFGLDNPLDVLALMAGRERLKDGACFGILV